jgi:hypothetical protein
VLPQQLDQPEPGGIRQGFEYFGQFLDLVHAHPLSLLVVANTLI